MMEFLRWHISNIPTGVDYVSELNRLTGYVYSESFIRGVVDGTFVKLWMKEGEAPQKKYVCVGCGQEITGVIYFVSEGEYHSSCYNFIMKGGINND